MIIKFLKENQEKGNPDVLDYISQFSPVAWQHINLNGEYSFSKKNLEINLKKLVKDIGFD